MDTAQSEKPVAGKPTAAALALPERQLTALRSYLLHLSRDDAERAEAVMEQLRKDAQTRSRSALADDPAGWFFREGRRLIFESGLKGEGREDIAQAEEDEVVAGEDLRVVVHRAIHRLTPKQEEALRLKFQFGFKLGELAHITRLSDQAANGLLHLAVTRVGQAICTAKGVGMPSVADQRLIPYALDELNAADKNSFIQDSPSSKALLESVEAVREWCTQIRPALVSGAPRSSRRRRSGAAGWKGKAMGVGALIIAGAAGVIYFVRQPEAVVEQTWQSSGVNGIGSLPEAVERRRPAREDRKQPSVDPKSEGARLADGVAAAKFSGGDLDQSNLPGLVSEPLDEITEGDRTGPAQPVGDESHRLAPGNHRKIPTTPVSREKIPAEARGSVGALEPTEPGDREKKPVDPDNELANGDANSSPVAADRSVAVDSKNNSPTSKQPGEPGNLDEGSDSGREESGQESKIAQKVPPKPSAGSLRRPLPGRRPSGPPAVKPAVLLREIPLIPAGLDQAEPIEATLEQAPSPWNSSKRIVRVSLRAKDVPAPARPVANVVFAIDISQSMTANARLDLVREGIRRLMDRLRLEDQVAIVTYADRADLALPTTLAAQAGVVRSCLAGLAPAGRTNGSDGLLLAYQVVQSGWIEGGLNEVVLCTDGNFNLGITDEHELASLAAAEARKGTRLSVIGFGRNDRNDLRLELLATNGGGQSGYVNTQAEAEQMLVGQINSLFAPVANNVAMQVEFNPENVLAARRLDDESALPGTGSVDRLLPGRNLTQLYEITPRYEAPSKEVRVNLAVHFNLSATGEKTEVVQSLAGTPREWARTGAEFRYATAILEFARILRSDPAHNRAALARLKGWIQANLPEDPDGYRRDLLFKVEQAGGESAAGSAVSGN